MPLTPNQRHKLLMADRTHDAGWIAAVIEDLLEANPTVTLLEIEQELRDAGAQTYLIAGSGNAVGGRGGRHDGRAEPGGAGGPIGYLRCFANSFGSLYPQPQPSSPNSRTSVELVVRSCRDGTKRSIKADALRRLLQLGFQV